MTTILRQHIFDIQDPADILFTQYLEGDIFLRIFVSIEKNLEHLHLFLPYRRIWFDFCIESSELQELLCV